MSESYDPNQDGGPPEEFDVVGEEGDAAMQSPRRAASAEFIVTSEVGSTTALRDAMDPANQSLADALRLSFRVLQFVILILIVLFLGSGITTVKDKQSGVLTRWGKIVSYQGEEALGSGLKHSWWPYPVSEFVLFDVENRIVNIMDTFLPNSGVRGLSISEHVERARDSDKYRMGVDGMLLTADGDIAHVAVSVSYEIDDPVMFVKNVPIDQADDIVRWATERAVINAVSTTTLSELMEITEDVRERIQASAQQSLFDIKCGIRIRQVQLPEPPRPPYNILKTFTELQTAGVDGEKFVQDAINTATTTRSQIVGANWSQILDLIEEYEISLEFNDEANSELLLAKINSWLETEAEGAASATIGMASSYQSTIDSTLGNEAKRFASLLPTFRDHPELVIRQRWDDARANILMSETAETFYVPKMLGRMNISISGLDKIAQIRRDRRLNRLNEAGWREGIDFLDANMQTTEQMKMSGPGRRLNIDEGRVTGQSADSTGTSGGSN